MEPMVLVFLLSAGLTLLWIAQRLLVLTQIDRTTRHWVRTIEQAPDHLVFPIVDVMSAHELRAREINAERMARRRAHPAPPPTALRQ